MTTARGLLRADLRRTTRDPMLLTLGIVPPALAAALRFASPSLRRLFDDPADFAAVADAATAGFLLLTPMMFGFLIGLLLLDERDEGVLAAVALTPAGKGGFLAYRMAVPVAWSAAASALIVRLVDPTPLAAPRLAAVAVVAGLGAPLFPLFLGAFAANKVEGVALSKVASILAGAGALGVLLPFPWQWLAAVSPHYWLVRLALSGEIAGSAYAGLVALALVAHAAVLWLMWRVFLRRVG